MVSALPVDVEMQSRKNRGAVSVVAIGEKFPNIYQFYAPSMEYMCIAGITVFDFTIPVGRVGRLPPRDTASNRRPPG